MKAQLTATGNSVQHKTTCMTTPKPFNPISGHWLSVLNWLERNMKAQLADSYCKLCVTQANMHDYASACLSHQRELAIRIKQFGEEHESTADSYRQLAVTQMNVLYTSQLFSPISVHLVYRKIVELLVFAWANIVTHLSKEFAFSQNLSALTIFQNRSQDSTLILVLLNAFLTVSH